MEMPSPPLPSGAETPSAETLQKRVVREKKARLEAEELLETKSLELYQVNQSLSDAARKAKNHVSRLNTIMNAMIDSVIVTDQDLVIQDANAQALTLLDVEREAVTEKSLFDFFTPQSQAAYKGVWARILAEPSQQVTTVGEDFTVSFEEGRLISVEVTLSTFKHNDGMFFLHYIRDISHRKEMEAEKQQMQQDLAHAAKWEAVGQLAGGIAHEINTPSQYIGDNLTFLIEGFPQVMDILAKALALKTVCQSLPDAAPLLSQLSETIEEHDLEFLLEEMPLALKQSHDGILQIAHIVLAMKRFSHPSADEKADIDLHQALETTLTVSKNEWKTIAEVETIFDPSVMMISGHASALNQVFLNLIVNAAHAIGEKKQQELGKITITTQHQDEYVRVSIADTGAGVPESAQDHIFNPFFTTKDVGKGTGQGLAIAHDIMVNKHKGQISFETTQGQGTTFHLLFPL